MPFATRAISNRITSGSSLWSDGDECREICLSTVSCWSRAGDLVSWSNGNGILSALGMLDFAFCGTGFNGMKVISTRCHNNLFRNVRSNQFRRN
ncbi:MAG: hypothetical protein IPP46_20070 [Bacteroidetes bacterium]|nr:hypothetical protein [Bacteroidota bacterium]